MIVIVMHPDHNNCTTQFSCAKRNNLMRMGSTGKGGWSGNASPSLGFTGNV